MDKRRRPRACVVGAGPVGCLAACMLARHHHYAVHLYDSRLDPRSVQAATRSRSINLAVSARGIDAMRAIDEDMARRIMQGVIPMKGRMLHDATGHQTSQVYGLNGECINSIDRNILNCSLIDEAESLEHVSLHFQHKLVKSDFDLGIHWFETGQRGEVEQVTDVDFTIGADGAWSRVRSEMMRVVRMKYSQEYIEHAYLELSIPAQFTSEGVPTFALDPNHLHIWPRHSFMLIALANQDKSFTCTLFAPFSTFDSLLPPPKTHHQQDQIIKFFKLHFNDAIQLIGEEEILRCFLEHPRGSLVTVKCSPYHYSDKVIIIGDAAHSMVPFYGQGMNCGLEDVNKLHTLLQQRHNHHNSIEKVLQTYSETRHDDLVSICGLAMQNYVEMRSSVTSWTYRLRKLLDSKLSQFPLFKGYWLPLYTMVTFRPDISYSEAVKREQRQKKWIERVLGITLLSFTIGSTVILSSLVNKWNQ